VEQHDCGSLILPKVANNTLIINEVKDLTLLQDVFVPQPLPDSPIT
jgi:hypothetical protein